MTGLQKAAAACLRGVAAGVVLAALASPAAVPAPAQAQADAAQRTVPYLTLRNRTGSSDPTAYYGDARSTAKAGWCDLQPRDFDGLASMADMLPDFLDEERLRVTRLRETSVPAVLESLAASAGDRPPALFTHGYFMSFEKGCRRAALFQDNAGLSGRMLMFSWPSDGALLNYMRDSADLYWSVPDLADTIRALSGRFPDRLPDIVGHSLGARGVALALSDIARRDPARRVGHVVLLAPDMDPGVFSRLLPDLLAIARSVTIYVNAPDSPLTLSSQLHGYPRLGDADTPLGSLQGVDIVDVSALNDIGPTGHLYHFMSAGVGADLDRLLNEGLRAEARPGLRRVSPNRWELLPRAVGND